MITVKSGELKQPEVRRTELGIEDMASLCLQMRDGWDQARPMIVTADRVVVAGNRRWMASMINEAYDGQGNEPTQEDMVAFIGTLATDGEAVQMLACPACGGAVTIEVDENDGDDYWSCENGCDFNGQEPVAKTESKPSPEKLAGMFEQMAQAYPGLEFPAMERDYTNGATLALAIVSDNFGQVDFDKKALARSFRTLEEGGIRIDQIAKKIGWKGTDVAGVIAMNYVPPQLVDVVLNNNLSLNIMALARKAGQNKASALAYLIDRHDHVTISVVEGWLKQMDELDSRLQCQLPLGEISPAKRNAERMERWLVTQALDLNPVGAYAAVASGQLGYRLCSVVGIEMSDVIVSAGLTCGKCALREILAKLPQLNWFPGYPCQRRADAKGCEYCVPDDDPVYIRVSGDMKGDVILEGAPYARDVTSIPVAEVEQSTMESTNAVPEQEPDAPLEAQRNAIAYYISTHMLTSGAYHPLATECVNCGYATAESPVKNDTAAPHCLWAKGRHKVDFGVIKSDTGVVIPQCKQYSPTHSLPEIISEWLYAPDKAREYYIRSIATLAEVLRQSRGQVLLPLTGTPYKASDTPAQIGTLFSEQVGDLSDGQLVTLEAWLMGEVQRKLNIRGGYMLPIEGAFALFSDYAYTGANLNLPE